MTGGRSRRAARGRPESSEEVVCESSKRDWQEQLSRAFCQHRWRWRNKARGVATEGQEAFTCSEVGPGGLTLSTALIAPSSPPPLDSGLCGGVRHLQPVVSCEAAMKAALSPSVRTIRTRNPHRTRRDPGDCSARSRVLRAQNSERIVGSRSSSDVRRSRRPSRSWWRTRLCVEGAR